MKQAQEIKNLLDEVEEKVQEAVGKILDHDDSKGSEEHVSTQIDIHSMEFLRQT